MYKCEILADSLNPQGDRITTFRLTYPRIIHAELMTHRMFSRNSASSRAIPFKKMVEMVEENPFIPLAWQKSHSGMQGTEYITDELSIKGCEAEWLEARNKAVEQAKRLSYYYITKQLCNRLLEPFMWHTVLVTATDWKNFFELRCPQYNYLFDFYKSKKDVLKASKDGKYNDGRNFSDFTTEDWLGINSSQADIHIQAIAEMMWDYYNESTPKKLEAGEWHIPFGDKINILLDNNNGVLTSNGIKEACKTIEYHNLRRVKIATARCARISYETLGDNPKIDYEADIKLHDKLIGPPFHASPFEHCARAMSNKEYNTFIKGILSLSEIGTDISYYEKDRDQKDNLGWCNNFKGFLSYRYLIENK